MCGVNGYLDAPHGDADPGADLAQFQARAPACGDGQFGVAEADAAQRVQQHTGHGREPQAQLVGPHRARRRTVSERIETAFLDPVLYLAALAVKPLVLTPGADMTRLLANP